MVGTRWVRYLVALVVVGGFLLSSSVASRAQDDADCAGVEDYKRSVQTLQEAYDQAIADIVANDVQDWTPVEVQVATEATSALISGLELMSPPAAAAELHDSLIESFTVWADLLTATSEAGILGALAFIDTFESISEDIDEHGLAFELACEVAFVDHADDGTPEIGLGSAATPVSTGTPDPLFPIGSLENPVPVGETVDVGGNWSITVVNVTPDATEEVLAENSFNEEPEDGRQFFVAAVTVQNTGTISASFNGNSRLRAFGQTDTYEAFSDRCGVVANEWETVQIAPGEQVTANICWSVHSEEAGLLRLFDSDAVTETRVYFSLTEGESDASPVASPDN